MAAAYLILVGYALLGLAYAPGLPALVALLFIAASAAPLLLALPAAPAERAVVHPAMRWPLFTLLLSLGVANVLLIANSLDVAPIELLTPEGFAAAAARSTARRYEEQGASGNPLLLALSLFVVYRVGAAARSASGWQQILAFVPPLLYTLISTEKWPLFLSGVFFLLGVFAAEPDGPALRRAARYVALFGLLGGLLAAVAMVLRGFEGDALELPALLLHYVLAPFPAFGGWWLAKAADQCCGLGVFSFIGPADQLGLASREAGVFAENFVIYDAETNIYTAWRYLVQDFSIAGPILINLALALAYLGCRQVKWLVAARALRSFVVCCALLSLNVTPFVHNSVALAITVALLYSAWVQRRSLALRPGTIHEPARTARLRTRQGQPATQAAPR